MNAIYWFYVVLRVAESDTINTDLWWLDLNQNDMSDRVRWKSQPPNQEMAEKDEKFE